MQVGDVSEERLPSDVIPAFWKREKSLELRSDCTYVQVDRVS